MENLARSSRPRVANPRGQLANGRPQKRTTVCHTGFRMYKDNGFDEEGVGFHPVLQLELPMDHFRVEMAASEVRIRKLPLSTCELGTHRQLPI